MADIAVPFLLNNLLPLLEQEVKLLSGARDKVTSLRKELEFISAFLDNSEGKRKEHDIVKVVVSQIRDVAYEAEDVVETFIANDIMWRRRNTIWKLVHGKHHVLMLHDVVVKIDMIKVSINEIYANKIKYSIEEGESTRGVIEAAESLRRRRRDVAEEEEVVGFTHDSSAVIKQLKEGGSGRKLVSIVGMGGLGKTTLARKIYNNNEVKELFPFRAFGYVSNDYRARELFLSLLQSLLSASEYTDLFKKKEDESEDALSEKVLKNKVRVSLNRKKYLVVLDDIWRTELWDEVQEAFPNDNCGSRILITSRMKEVANYASENETPPYELPFLNEEESWELFSKKVFRERRCPSDLEPLAKILAKSCDGLPLAIIVLAGLLAKREKSRRVWHKIRDHVNWFLGQKKTGVRDILKLSYDSLPRGLKPCFLYLGIYPEDYEIPVRQLIHLWIAEGLILETGTRSSEDLAEDYLEELVDRSLVQVASKRSDEGVKTCRIHDLLRDLCISESKDEKFFEVCMEADIQKLSNPRRLSLLCNTMFYMSSAQCDHSSTRSLFCFDQRAPVGVQSHHSKRLLENFKSARVLDLGRLVLPLTRSDLENFIHLRYLKIRTNTLKVIPASVCNLWNLETLDLRNPFIWPISPGFEFGKVFPKEMWKLKRLRHLYSDMPMELPNLSRSDDTTVWNLQTLSAAVINSRTMSLLENGRFPKLIKLDLYNEKHTLPKFSQSLHSLSDLRRLKLIRTSKVSSLVNAFPSNLTKITLAGYTEFDESSMDILGRLPNLEILKLSCDRRIVNFALTNLNCAAGGFPQLQVFHMKGLHVKSWRLEKGAMPLLKRLVFKLCLFSTELPEELWSLTDLREVQALRLHRELANMLQNLAAKNGCKVITDPFPTAAESDAD